MDPSLAGFISGAQMLRVELATAYDANPTCRFVLSTRPQAGLVEALLRSIAG